MIAFALAALLSLPSTHMEERRRLAEELEVHPEPALETRAGMARVRSALRTPESLWRFVIAPETEWADRMVAAQRAKLPMNFLPRVAAVDRQLAREEGQHAWGMERFIPRYSAIAYFPRPEFRGRRTRRIIGREWELPREIIDEPLTYDERAGAPWPWQVQQAIAILRKSFFDPSRAAEFWEASLQLPRDDVEEARYFYQLTDQFAVLVRWIDPRVIAAWRAIGLHEGDFVDLRPEIAYAFDAIGASKRGHEALYGEVMMADWAEHWSARDIVALAFHLRGLLTPHVAIETLARRIDGLGVEDVFTRGYSARYFLEAVDRSALPKAAPNPNAAELLERDWLIFRDWYGAHFEQLREAALAQEKVLAPYR